MKKVVICLIVILIIAILGVGGWFLFDNLQKEKSRTNELESKVTAMESKNENNNSNEENENKSNSNESKNEKSKENSTQTYDSLKGTYESQKINMNEGTNSEPVYMNYTIVLSKEGTFSAYYKCGDTDAHYVGYYTINENQVTMNSVVLVGNDPSASLCNEVLKFNLNSDGSFSDSENNKFSVNLSAMINDANSHAGEQVIITYQVKVTSENDTITNTATAGHKDGNEYGSKESKTYEGKSQLVTAVVGGNNKLISINIDVDSIEQDDKEMLEDMILTAVNDGMKQIDELTEKEMAKVTGGMKLPGMF